MINTIVPKIRIKINWDLILKSIPRLMLIAIILKVVDEIQKPKPVYYFPSIPQAPKKRKEFSESTKKDTMLKQRFVCNECKQSPEFWEFHHKDWNRSNNSPGNCEGLCLNCHAKKTRNK